MIIVNSKMSYKQSLLENDIAKLADILGHSSVNTTRSYLMPTDVEHRRK